MVNKKVVALLFTSGFICFACIILSLYSISTANWSTFDQYSIGLFQTCTNTQCTKNIYADANNSINSSLVFAKRFYYAAPLAIVGVFIQIVSCALCFVTSYIYLPPKPSITCYLLPLLIFITFLFQLSVISEASHGIHLNGQSATVYESVLVFQVIATIFTFAAAGHIRKVTTEYV